MSKLFPLEGALKNLKQEIAPGSRAYLSKDKALELLRSWTGQDFGYDVAQWEEWIKRYGEKSPVERESSPSEDRG